AAHLVSLHDALAGAGLGAGHDDVDGPVAIDVAHRRRVLIADLALLDAEQLAPRLAVVGEVGAARWYEQVLGAVAVQVSSRDAADDDAASRRTGISGEVGAVDAVEGPHLTFAPTLPGALGDVEAPVAVDVGEGGRRQRLCPQILGPLEVAGHVEDEDLGGIR